MAKAIGPLKSILRGSIISVARPIKGLVKTASRDGELVTGTLHQLTLLDPRAGMYLMSSTITATARVFVFLSAR